MDAILLDTNVFSYLLKEADSLATLYRPHIQDRIIVISYVTIGELYLWADARNWGVGRLRLLEEKIRATTVVRYDLEVCKTYARLKHGLRTPSGSHRVIGDNDLWIAACAVRYAIPLVTHNRRHFEGIPGLTIICEAPQL